MYRQRQGLAQSVERLNPEGEVPGGDIRGNSCCVCAAGLSESFPHLQSILRPIIDSILVNFGQGRYFFFLIPT